MHTCRICRDTHCLNMVLISENNGILSLYEYCFGLTVTIQDQPRLLCKQCAESVKKYASFKDQCLKSEKLWTSVTTEVDCDEKVLPNCVKTENINLQSTNNDRSQSHETVDMSYENNYLFNDEEDESMPIKVEDPIQLNIDKLEKEDADSINIDDKINNEKHYRISKTKIKKNFKCKMCKKVYEKEKWYLEHIKLCNHKKRKSTYQLPDLSSRKEACEIPVTKYDQQKTKYSEIKINNKDRPIIYCGLCNLTFSSDISIVAGKRQVSSHLDEHWSSNELECKLCDFVGADLAALFVHRFSHNPTAHKPRYVCHICMAFKLSAMSLQFHYRSEHLKKIGGLCSKCNKEFPSLYAWKRHEKRHTTTPNFICDVCDKRFRYKFQIREHVMDHLDLNKYICHECGKIFRRSKNLKLHMNGVHAKMGPIKCSHCNRMFKSKQTLMVHLSVVQRKKKLKCEYCFKEFSSACYLKEHMVMHSEERPYSCHICGLSYKAKSQLKVHLIKHTGFMPHKCELCTKSFATTHQLKRHAAVHTGLRAHKCSHCDRTFHDKKLLAKHCALRHKMAEANNE